MNYIKLFDSKQYFPYNGDDNNIVFNKKEIIIIINFLCQKKLISKRIFNYFHKEYNEYEKNNDESLFFSSNKMELMVYNYLIVLHSRYSHPTISKINDDYYILSIKGIKYKCDQLSGLKKCINNEVLKYHI